MAAINNDVVLYEYDASALYVAHTTAGLGYRVWGAWRAGRLRAPSPRLHFLSKLARMDQIDWFNWFHLPHLLYHLAGCVQPCMRTHRWLSIYMHAWYGQRVELLPLASSVQSGGAVDTMASRQRQVCCLSLRWERTAAAVRATPAQK